MEIKTVHIEGHIAGDLAYVLWEPQGVCRGSVVCVHGLSRQKRDFDFIAAYLSRNGYRVYSVDTPGRGGSVRFSNPDLYRLDIYADVFAAFLEKMKLTSVHWIGTSMGGLIAMAMAEKDHAHFFKTVTLIDITHKPNPKACERIASYMSENVPVLPNVESYIDFLKINLPLGEVPESIWRHYAEHQLIKTDQGYVFHFDPKIARRAQIDLRKEIDLTAGLKKINCPLMLIAGEISDLCTVREIEDVKAIKPSIRLRICPKAGHVPALADEETQKFILQGLLN